MPPQRPTRAAGGSDDPWLSADWTEECFYIHNCNLRIILDNPGWFKKHMYLCLNTVVECPFLLIAGPHVRQLNPSSIIFNDYVLKSEKQSDY